MNIRFMLNNEDIYFNVNSNQPLSYTLMELNKKANRYLSCHNNSCGLCIVLNRKTDEILQSCLTPMFKLQGADIITPDYFYAQKIASYVKVAYRDANITPCDDCIQKRTLLFDWIATVLDNKNVVVKKEKDSIFFQQLDNEKKVTALTPRMIVEQNKSFILSTQSIIKCSCLPPGDILKIAEAVITRRRH